MDRDLEEQMYFYMNEVDDMPDITDDEPTENFGTSLHEALQALFSEGAVQNENLLIRKKALASLIPLIDAGIDIMAVEGAVKDPQFRTLEGQNEVRQTMVDGAVAALRIFGVTDTEFDEALQEVVENGVRTRQNDEDIVDRLPTWDRLSVINMLYGPRMAGRILSGEFGEQ